jgi:tetratricopeptide (TPR) repeat protein
MTKHVLLIILLCASAHASVWDHALNNTADDATRDLYDAKMSEGDGATLLAMVESTSLKSRLELIKHAEAAYQAAAAARPHEAEPYFRIGNLLYQMYFACDPPSLRLSTCDPAWATAEQQAHTVEAWDEFERRAPLDPRVNEILLPRAIQNTKLIDGSVADRRHLEAAARDYQAALDRNDGLSKIRDDEQLLGNLAETYMMLGRLDEAISTYLQAISVGVARVSTMYGFAVALDRDGAGDQAIQRILAQGTTGFDAFQKEFIQGSVFFVPRGEENYYFALSNEAFGYYGPALEYWNRFIASGVHREFQPRAREHIEQLRKKHVHAEPPPPELEDRNW